MSPQYPGNQVHRAANGLFFVLWRGRLMNYANGLMRYFDTEREASDFVERCDAADRASGADPAPAGFQTQVYANPRRPRRMPV